MKRSFTLWLTQALQTDTQWKDMPYKGQEYG